MDFIKRHYEKMLLLFMLVLFIGIMFYVMQVAQRARSISDADLKLPDLKADYTPQPASGNKDRVRLLVEGSEGRSNWVPSVQRDAFASDLRGLPPNRPPIEGTFSDLVVVFPIATCPHCQKLVPRYYFNNRKCPACAGELRTPPQRPKERRFVISENDQDGDGLPNDYERTNGFDPKDPGDGLADADGDGFSNLYEYENKTNPKDPRSRPPLWYRLRYISMESVDLPIRLMAVNTMDSKDKKSWNIQFNRIKVDRRGRPVIDRRTNQPREETMNQQLGDVIGIEEFRYKITDVEYKAVKKGGTTEQKDLSSVRLVQVLPPDSGNKKPDVLVMYAGRIVKSNDKRLIIEDVKEEHNRPRFTLRLGAPLSVGDRRTGTENYRLVSVDEAGKTARFDRVGPNIANPSRDKNGKLIEITRESEIPEDLQVRATKKRVPQNEEGGRPDMGER